MIFTVTYRAKDGAIRKECVEAVDRAACVAACRRRGIAPTGIKEGGSPRAASVESPRRGRAALVAAVSVLLLFLAGGAWLWLGGRGEAPAREKARPPKVAKPKAEKPVRQPRAKAPEPPAATNDAPAAAAPEREMYLGKEVVSHSYITNATGRSVREIIVTADGKKHGRTTVIAKPTFKYGTDQMLADVLFPPEHGQLPPWPEMDAKALDREFARSVLEPIKILDDDPEDVRIRKEAVKQARSEMVQLLKEGHSVLEVMQKQREGNEHAHEMQLTVARELHRLRREGASREAVRDYLDKANQLLEQSGIGPVAEPGNPPAARRTGM